MAQQLTFDLPARTALGRDDFFVSPANAVAVAAVDGWGSWPGGRLILTGPKGSGKTHLVHVWAKDAEAVVLSARELTANSISELVQSTTNIAIEDIETIAGNPDSEQVLFHLYNMVLSEGGRLLMTAVSPPGTWPLTLPDLKSRLQGSNLANLAPPDDALLSAVLVKLFADRQIDVSTSVIDALTKRMERSFDTAAHLVADLDALSLTERRPITRNMVTRVLDNRPHGGA